MNGITIEDYTPEMSDACMAIENRSPQGESYRLRFDRKKFHLRSECFENRRILIAKKDQKIIATLSFAIKDIVFHGKKVKASIGFDAASDPLYRRHSAMKQLLDEFYKITTDEGVEIHYGYTVGDNLESQNMLKSYCDFDLIGSYGYLVWPSYRKLNVKYAPVCCGPEEVHVAQTNANKPFDSYTDINRNGTLKGYVTSFKTSDAGCSVWDNSEMLQEVVVSIPGYYKLAKMVLNTFPLNLFKWPHIPAPQEPVKSWYIYDFYANKKGSAIDLMRHVNNQAIENDIDYCYIIHNQTNAWMAELQAGTPKLFSPVIPYNIWAKSIYDEVAPVKNFYIDVRDL